MTQGFRSRSGATLLRSEYGEVQFRPEDEQTSPPEITEETETHCELCSWHGKFKTLNRPR